MLSVSSDKLSSNSVSCLHIFEKYVGKFRKIFSEKISSKIFENFENFFEKFQEEFQQLFQKFSRNIWEKLTKIIKF